MNAKSYEYLILGAGPAGLAAALRLTQNGLRNIGIVDRNGVIGGLSRTETKGGVRFDIGPHRFFSKSREINQVWHDTLGEDFVPVDRLTRIYYKNKFFNYPIKAFDALSKLGPLESVAAFLSFIEANRRRRSDPGNFEDWITWKFGTKLYETFFKTYTEKVWGIPCSEISAEWASQRIKGLDILQTIKNALFTGTKNRVKTLVEEFHYPILGAGQMYEAMADTVASRGVDFTLDARITGFNRVDDQITSVDIIDGRGTPVNISARHFFSSIPLTHFFEMLTPPPAPSIQRAAESLYYREHITVDLLVDGDGLFPDQWLYIHAPDMRMARVANYNNFSRAMVGHKKKTALSAEYFVFQHDDVWKRSDEDLAELAVDELAYMNLIDRETIEKAWVVRETEAYPTYYLGFQEPYEKLKSELDGLKNLYSIGRGGMYKYNNQDHSIMSGLLAADNCANPSGTPYNLWQINVDAEYHEGAEQ